VEEKPLPLIAAGERWWRGRKRREEVKKEAGEEYFY
jgi:hypothetical protein